MFFVYSILFFSFSPPPTIQIITVRLISPIGVTAYTPYTINVNKTCSYRTFSAIVCAMFANSVNSRCVSCDLSFSRRHEKRLTAGRLCETYYSVTEIRAHLGFCRLYHISKIGRHRLVSGSVWKSIAFQVEAIRFLESKIRPYPCSLLTYLCDYDFVIITLFFFFCLSRRAWSYTTDVVLSRGVLRTQAGKNNPVENRRKWPVQRSPTHGATRLAVLPLFGLPLGPTMCIRYACNTVGRVMFVYFSNPAQNAVDLFIEMRANVNVTAQVENPVECFSGA